MDRCRQFKSLNYKCTAGVLYLTGVLDSSTCSAIPLTLAAYEESVREIISNQWYNFADDLYEMMNKCEVVILCNADTSVIFELSSTSRPPPELFSEWGMFTITDCFSVKDELDSTPFHTTCDVVLYKPGVYSAEHMMEFAQEIVWKQLRITPVKNGDISVDGAVTFGVAKRYPDRFIHHGHHGGAGFHLLISLISLISI